MKLWGIECCPQCGGNTAVVVGDGCAFLKDAFSMDASWRTE